MSSWMRKFYNQLIHFQQQSIKINEITHPQHQINPMHQQHTHRSNISSKYVTPRKNIAKNKKINLFINDYDQSTIDCLPTCTHRNVESFLPAKEWKITDFQIIKQMGRGKFGYVYAAKEKQTDYLVALKKMSKKELKENDFQEQVKRQIIIQASLSHQNILKLYGYFWDTQNVYLILQYAPSGELFNILQKSKKLPQSQVSIIIRQICQGLLYLHQNCIIHRDIKPQNILISGQNAKIGDFGWSIHTDQRRETLCGTLDYLAPEIVKGETHDNSIDIWQVGILTYELAVGHPPFETKTNQETYQRILNKQVEFPTYMSYELRKFIRKVLQKIPSKRMSCAEILKQPFIKKYQDLKLSLNKNN